MKKSFKEDKEEQGHPFQRRIIIPESLSTFLERAHIKYYPKMFKSVRDFSIFVLREWVDNIITKDPELAEGLDFSDFY